jgi:hypothetical protein
MSFNDPGNRSVLEIGDIVADAYDRSKTGVITNRRTVQSASGFSGTVPVDIYTIDDNRVYYGTSSLVKIGTDLTIWIR